MKYTFLLSVNTLCLLFCCCKTLQPSRSDASSLITAANPMSCKIEGTILSISKTPDADTGSICARYPCKAKVRIISVSDCGSSVAFTLNSGDTVEVRFAYTLENTSKVLPAMKARYPGLKRGNTFLANVEQRLKPGADGEYIVYGYQLTP